MKGPIARNTLRTAFVLGLRLVVQAGTLLILARLLEPSGFGMFAALAALAVFLGTLATFGTHLTLLRDLSRDPMLREESVRFALGTTTVCGISLLGLYILLCIAWLHLTATAAWVIVGLGVAELLLQPFLSIAAMERHAHGEIAGAQILLGLPLLLRLCAAVAIWASETMHPLSAYVACHAAAVACSLLLGLSVLPQPWPRPSRWRVPRLSEWREHSGYAFLNMTGAGPTELDKTLAAHLLPLGIAGVYAAAARVSGAMTVPVIALMLSALPRLFRESPGNHGRLLRYLFIAAAGYGIAAGIVVWLAAPFVQRLFGSPYIDLVQYLRWLALAAPGLSLRIIAANALTTVDQPWLRIGLETVGLGLLVVLAWLLTSSSWPQGLAAAVVCTEWTLAILCWIALWVVHSHSRIQRQCDTART